MSSVKRKSANKFLAGYREDGGYLVTPDPARGRPGMLRARDPEGREVLVKVWPRTVGSDDEDFEQIWRSEIQQLQRLAAVPRAEELFVPMVSSGEDDEGFYLVLDPGQGSPLQIFRGSENPPPILAQPKIPRNRRRLWANALRIAEALELLHSQGVIHRNVDPWAIVTAFGDQPDFRLTGFEWSMRIATIDGSAPTLKPLKGQDDQASFGRDWINLGILVAELVGAPLDRVANLRLVPSEIAEHLSAPEGQVLRSMLQLETADRLDGEMTCRRMSDVVSAITAQAAGREARLALSISLGSRSRVAEAIRKASDNEIEMFDVPAQVEFISDDLSRETFFARLKSRDSPDPRFALLGQFLTYTLAPYRQPGSSEASDWEFASCERADVGRPVPGAIEASTILDATSLDLVPSTDASQSFPRRRGRVERWDDYLQATEPKAVRKTDLDRMHQAFSLLLVLEMAYAAADVFPVEILPGSADKVGDLYTLRVASRHDPDRAALSAALELDAPAVRLTKLLDSEEIRDEGAWTLSEAGSLGDRTQDTEWGFVQRTEENAREILRFEGQVRSQVRGNGFIATPGMRGDVSQFKRRRKALKALSEHTELLRMLVDPRLRIENSHDPLDEKDSRFRALDNSKQEALREILSTIPLFLLQGPPGVGKTYLVGDIVRRRFEDDPTTRMLLSAQSNPAIDHLMKEVETLFPGEGDGLPVMVRARPADDDPADTDLEIDVQAARLLQALSCSDLVAEANPTLREKVIALARARQEVGSRKGKLRIRRMSAEGRAFEGMILRAANLVFATTNSSAVERLIEERSLFDWTIIEEAGKATGGELLSPLLLSHRRLMIGDHKQLPPYGADVMTRLLASPEKVKAAVIAAQDLISRYLKDPGIEELFDEVEAELEDFGRLCSDTLSVLTLFETLVEAEFKRQSRGKTAAPAIARRLDVQHRMHPAIARLVSTCFYEGKLSTNPKKEQEYRKGPPPVRSVDTARLPENPIVFVDMPYVRSAHGYRGGERAPPWSNPDEVDATLSALALLRPERTISPSLAVLSPYNKQVIALQHQLSSRRGGPLHHVKDFRPAVGDGDYCGTVDSFQGDQADIVLISMVRNNGHASPGRALGFLRDDRRMNVLLSRAKWRMIIVGSLDFYRNIVEFSKVMPDADIGFLGRFLDALAEAERAGDASIVPWARLSGKVQ
jgi:serine/threonine protein kinase